MAIENDKLHINELKVKFSNKQIISVDDFYDFYKNVFGKINRKTVSWYIYDLKKRNIITHIARGQYALTQNYREESDDYVVITMDVINSTNYETAKFKLEIGDKIKKANYLIEKYYNYDRKFDVFQGDEIQGLFKFDDNIKYLIMIILCCLRPFEVRYGISIGKINDTITDNSWYMNGPIFWNARDQLNEIKNSKEYTGLLVSEHGNADKYCNSILPIINKSISRITEKQWEAIEYEICNVDVNIAIKNMDIGVSSYYDRISVSNYHEIISAIGAILNIEKQGKL